MMRLKMILFSMMIGSMRMIHPICTHGRNKSRGANFYFQFSIVPEFFRKKILHGAKATNVFYILSKYGKDRITQSLPFYVLNRSPLILEKEDEKMDDDGMDVESDEQPQEKAYVKAPTSESKSRAQLRKLKRMKNGSVPVRRKISKMEH